MKEFLGGVGVAICIVGALCLLYWAAYATGHGLYDGVYDAATKHPWTINDTTTTTVKYKR